MPNPYGITEVDIPGVIGAYQNQQDRRLQQMAAQRQIQLQDRQFEQQDKAAQAWAKYAQRTQGGAAGAVGAYGAPSAPEVPAQPGVAPQQAPAASQPSPEDELFNTLVTVDPQQAIAFRNQLQQHSLAEQKALQEEWNRAGTIALELRQLPEQERLADFDRQLPTLRAQGYDEGILAHVRQTLAQGNSDRFLEGLVDHARDIEAIARSLTPTVVPVSGVGLVPMTPGSPYPDFANGGARPEAQVGQAQGIGEGTVIQNDAGEQMILRNGQWVPAGGGAGNGTGGFPGN